MIRGAAETLPAAIRSTACRKHGYALFAEVSTCRSPLRSGPSRAISPVGMASSTRRPPRRSAAREPRIDAAAPIVLKTTSADSAEGGRSSASILKQSEAPSEEATSSGAAYVSEHETERAPESWATCRIRRPNGPVPMIDTSSPTPICALLQAWTATARPSRSVASPSEMLSGIENAISSQTRQTPAMPPGFHSSVSHPAECPRCSTSAQRLCRPLWQ